MLSGLLVGLGQLWRRSRVCGLMSLAATTRMSAAFQITSWLLLDLRGISDGVTPREPGAAPDPAICLVSRCSPGIRVRHW